MKIITRFAPSPTGNLHIGNVRIALINWLYTRKYNGTFILRIDDTDHARNDKAFVDDIVDDLKWLGIDWDISFTQSSRSNIYANMAQHLINSGRIYECYESPEELQYQREIQLASGKPPIYNRYALTLTSSEKQKLQQQGRKPYYRFLIDRNQQMTWHDLIKGKIKYHGNNISDPVAIRDDGSIAYLLSSVMDDIDYEVSHIIRGEDHITNTAIQIQMFAALATRVPQFGHLGLLSTKDHKISKRIGGFSVRNLRDNVSIEPMVINSWVALSGTSQSIALHSNLSSLISDFDLSNFSKGGITYDERELLELNRKLIMNANYAEVKDQLNNMNLDAVDEEFWLAVRSNINTLSDVKLWWQICHYPQTTHNFDAADQEFLLLAAQQLPEGILDTNSWKIWINAIRHVSNRRGKEAFLPIRLALTGMEHGPELQYLLPLIGREQVILRLTNASKECIHQNCFI